MSERCLLGTGPYWNNEGAIPEACLEQCEPIWREAAQGPIELDVFSKECMESCPIEFGDEAVQRHIASSPDSKRQYSILNMCMNHTGIEMYAEE